MVEPKDILFPHEHIRQEQHILIDDIIKAINEKRNLVAHAPTGLGKTAAALSPALKYAIDNNMTVFFLTSRHTQHQIAIQTLKEIKEKYGAKFNAVTIIGKKWMCAVPNISSLYSSEFLEYCKNMRESDQCVYYGKTKGKYEEPKLTVEAKKVLDDMKHEICSTEEIIESCSRFELCPYEISMELAKKAIVIVADYYYVFNPHVSQVFFKKIGAELEKSIIIIDEAHNLPGRIRELATSKLNSIMLMRAIKEAKKFGYSETLGYLVLIQDALNELASHFIPNYNSDDNNFASSLGELRSASSLSQKSPIRTPQRNFSRSEAKVEKQNFISLISKGKDYEEVLEDLLSIAESVRAVQKRSFIGGVAAFLQAWKGTDEGFTRIIKNEMSKEGPIVTLGYICLDPSLVLEPIINSAHSSIFMSGTLTPTFMYRDLLGVQNCSEQVYNSPFPQKNRLNLIVPQTTTKFEKRTTQQFQEIGRICADVVNVIKGNVFVFFPSYKIRDSSYLFFMNACKKTIFLEDPKMSKEEKVHMLEKFKTYKKTGAVLLGVTSGSFGEGVDMPGDLLNGVVVVGLPLGVPDLEVRELIDYFDKKYKKGWEYGYLYPAFQKTLQNAGRCIRSETDRGVIVFLDERYAWPRYKQCFPEDYGLVVSNDYRKDINEFFNSG